jgi:hypothetical protein
MQRQSRSAPPCSTGVDQDKVRNLTKRNGTVAAGQIDALDIEGRKIVVQTEDKGSQRQEIVTSAFEGGALVFRRAVSYSDLVDLGLSDQEAVLTEALRAWHAEALRSLTQSLKDQW